MKAASVIIFGASGFLGRHLTKHLQNNKYHVIPVTRQECDLRSEEDVKTVFNKFTPDFVINLASKVSPGRSTGNFKEQFENTILPAVNIANHIPQTVKLALFVGSIEEYGTNISPFSEQQMPNAFSTYGWGKISSYFAVQYICRQRKIPYTWIRPSLMFGSGVSENLFFGHVLKSCLRNENVSLTSGEQKRDFIYVKDVCRFFEKIIKSPDAAKSQIINFSSSRGIPVKVMAELVQKMVGKGKLNFGVIPYRSDESMEFFSSDKHFQNLYGDEPLTDLNFALQETINEEKSL